MIVTAPDPTAVRARNLEELYRLRLPLPPSTFPMVWDPGDAVELRPVPEMEARIAILNVVLSRAFGMPSRLAMTWLLDAHLMERVTQPEWHYVASGQGDDHSFALHLEALTALAWLLGLTNTLDPAAPVEDNLTALLPNLREGESFPQWRSRSLVAPRDPVAAAIVLDLYYCLDWAYLDAERRGHPLPGLIDSNAIGQRRWALEWAVVFHGPHHTEPVGWEDVDLST
jgi:Domain of unknown function (DUF4272)